MLTISIIISILYVSLILLFIIGFDKLPVLKNDKTIAKNTFSIVIPFRNEAESLPTLLNSLKQLNYEPQLFEILLMNDSSTDDSCEIIEKFKNQHQLSNLQIINTLKTTSSPKKNAITKAIDIAKFDWIITTDADCTVPTNWLQMMNQFIETKQPYFIAAPVKFTEENSFLFHFQNLNFLSLIGTTIGSFGIQQPFLCNGANVCYRKDIFKQLNGFEGNTKIASGDDVFLLEKIAKIYPEKTLFLKSDEVLVKTKAAHNWNSFINQQIRWASKSAAYKNWFSIAVGLIVLLQNIWIIILLSTLINSAENLKILIPIVLQKMLFDTILIEKTAKFVQSKISIHYLIISSFLYPIFMITIGILSMFKTYEWKGRKFKK